MNFLALMAALLAWSTLSYGGIIGGLDPQDVPTTNKMENGGFENGESRWTASGSSVLSSVTSGVNLGKGARSGSWDASAAAETLTSSQVTVDAANGNELCGLSFLYKGGDANITAEVVDGSLTVLGSTVLVAATNYIKEEFTFICPTSGTIAFRLVAAADAAIIYLDGVFLGPGTIATGAVVSSWTDFTPGSVQNWPSTSEAGRWRRVGDTMELELEFELSGGASATLTWDSSNFMPAGHSIDESALIGVIVSDVSIVGVYSSNDAAASKFTSGFLQYDNSLNDIAFVNSTSGSRAANGVDSEAYASGDNFHLKLSLPITEWAGSGVLNTLSQDNLNEWQSYTPVLTNLTVGAGGIVEGTWRRVGDTMQVQAYIDAGTSPTTGGNFRIQLPPGYNIDSTKIPSPINLRNLLGGAWFAGATNRHSLLPMWDSSDSTRVIFRDEDSSTLVGTDFGNNYTLSTIFTVPIVEFAGSQNSLVGFSAASTEQAGLVTTDAQTFAGEKTFIDLLSGSFTPDLGGSTTDPTGVSYTNQEGSWQRFGSVVLVSYRMEYTTYTGGSGNVLVKNLPFDVSATHPVAALGICEVSAVTFGAGFSYITNRPNLGTASLTHLESGDGIQSGGVNLTQTPSNGTNKAFRCSAQYFTDDTTGVPN